MNSYDEDVTKKPRLVEQTPVRLNVSSLLESLQGLPDVLDGKASRVLNGTFSEKTLAIRKIPNSLRDRADRDLKVMEMTQDLSETVNCYFHFHLSHSSVFFMPLLEHNLEQYLEIKKPERPSQNNIIFKIASGLSELHKRGIVHTDLRPTKIFILGETGKERIILSNFRKSKVDGTMSNIITKSAFASPDVRHKIPTHVSLKDDSFSLGLIAYYVWIYNKPEGDSFRTFPNVEFIQTLRGKYLNNADVRFLHGLLDSNQRARLSAEEAIFHPALWGNNGIGSYMSMLDDILRNPTSKREKWMKAFNVQDSDDWRKEASAAKILSGMQDPKSYTDKKKCFVRFIRNVFTHFRTIEAAKMEIETREGLGDWVLRHFESLFFDIFTCSFRYMDGFYARFFPR